MLTVATANTQEARLLAVQDGLLPFHERGVDVLLLQETHVMTDTEVGVSLQKQGFNIAHHIGAMGLTIAIATTTDAIRDVGDARVNTVDSPRETLLMKHVPGLAKRMRLRGMLAVELQLADESRLNVATAHPIVFARPFVRKRQIHDIDTALRMVPRETALVLGMDANHYPGPWQIDHAMVGANGLRRVMLEEPTWPIAGSKHEWLTKLPIVASTQVMPS